MKWTRNQTDGNKILQKEGQNEKDNPHETSPGSIHKTHSRGNCHSDDYKPVDDWREGLNKTKISNKRIQRENYERFVHYDHLLDVDMEVDREYIYISPHTTISRWRLQKRSSANLRRIHSTEFYQSSNEVGCGKERIMICLRKNTTATQEKWGHAEKTLSYWARQRGPTIRIPLWWGRNGVRLCREQGNSENMNEE